MTDQRPEVVRIQEWLVNDQYQHGEWGRSEQSNPTDDVRTLNHSRLKPNLFTSSQAVLALQATGWSDPRVFDRFFGWLTAIRHEDGYWTNASGSQVPMGPTRGWSEVRNIRHTAKALDLLLLRGFFVSADSAVLHEVLHSQCPNGAFPQVPEGTEDIWSTAYAMNLLIRAMHQNNLQCTLPRNTTLGDWESRLRTHLDRARAWLSGQVSADGLWHFGGRDPVWITEALLSEVGADLTLSRPDLCRVIAAKLLECVNASRAVRLWGLLLCLPSLSTDQQKRVTDTIRALSETAGVSDTFEASCLCRLLWAKHNPDLIGYYVSESRGHESALPVWEHWADDLYNQWCIRNAMFAIERGASRLTASPSCKAEAWLSAWQLLQVFRQQIEEGRGWELLWHEGKPRDEKAAQVSFWNTTKPLSNTEGLLTREPETGVGPVDFQFSNGFLARVHIEFKLASHARLEHGMRIQLPRYMSAGGVDSAFYVIIGFGSDDQERFQSLEAEAAMLRQCNPEFFIQVLYVDASPKRSASKA